MKTIITGPRYFNEYATLCEAMEKSGFTVSEVVSGGAPGGDKLGERWAAEKGKPIKMFAANRETFGRIAGSFRDAQMLEYADALLAVWDGDGIALATLIQQARAKGLEVYVHMIDPGSAVSPVGPEDT